MGKLNRVLIMAGGTGGHVFPGLAVAKRFQEEGIDVQWLGTSKGMEAELVPNAGLTLHTITINGIRKNGLKNLLLAPSRLLFAVFQAMAIIRKLQPDVVLGMGGFASGPGGIASWLLKKPLIIHEQNAKPGMTNQWLAKVAKKILEGFPNTFANRYNVVTTGNPVRLDIVNLTHPEQRLVKQRPLHLLVVGGSLGAIAINQLVPKALGQMPETLRPVVLHQTGSKNFSETLQAYTAAGIKADVQAFIQDMSQAYSWADIVLCRAGALTVAELCAAGLGAILVPYPYAVDDHQTANANFMVKNKAGILVQQAALTEQKLIEIIIDLQLMREKCIAMAKAAYDLRQVNATDHVYQICKEVCQ